MDKDIAGYSRDKEEAIGKELQRMKPPS